MTEDSVTPPPENGPKVHEPRREKAKAFGKNWLIGSLILVVFSAVGHFGNSVGIQSIDIKAITSPAGLVELLTHTNWQTGLFVFFTLAGIGAITLLLVTSETAFGKLFRLHNDAVITDKALNDQIRKDLRKFRLLPIIVWMVLVGIIVLPLIGGVYALSGINTNNAQQILGLFTVSQILDAVIVIIGGAVVGWVVRHLRNQYEKIYNKIEPYVSKTRVL